MTWAEVHPALNASLNGIAAACLVAGGLAIRNKDTARHRAAMLAALSASALFLVSYLVRVAMTGTHRYPGDGWDRTVYLVLLGSHTVLAVVALPLVLRTAYLALSGRFPSHRRIARWSWPVWIYVSITGVLVYGMLYHLAPYLHG